MPNVARGAAYGSVFVATAALGYYTWKVVEDDESRICSFGREVSYPRGRVEHVSGSASPVPGERPLVTRVLCAIPDSFSRATSYRRRVRELTGRRSLLYFAPTV